MNPIKYPIGVETFEEIRKHGYLYIDKTEYIHKLLSEGKYYFLSRPRRFGKSLLLTTLKAYFEGKKNLFKGLSIEKYDFDWQPRPVFYLNFANTPATKEGIEAHLERIFSKWEDLYGDNESEVGFASRFAGLIERAATASGRQVAVLIDEYDKTLNTSLYTDIDLHAYFRSELKAIYGNLKSMDSYIAFAFITGVTRFSRLSIFSDINNLRDISLSDSYAAICGITEDELRLHCKQGVMKFAAEEGLSEEECLSVLKNNYDGYHFTQKSPDIYNPFSLFNALQDCRIAEYWYATGTPTFLIHALKSNGFFLPDLNGTQVVATTLSQSELHLSNPVGVLFQAGYLTIDSYDPQSRRYTLRVPNKEVETGLLENLMQVYMGERSSVGRELVFRIEDAAFNGEPERMLTLLKAFMADIPYELSGNKPEIYFENNLYIIFRMIGLTARTEYRTASGRIDILIETPKYVYIMELKLKGSALSALRQINEKDYIIPFMTGERKIFKIGVSFSSRTRNIAAWKIEFT